MEYKKISSKQLFSLIFLFEIGSAVVVGLGMKAKQDAWLAILIGMICGIIIFLMYNYLFINYPKLILTNFIEKILGKFLGRILAFIYILYFMYIASRVLRDIGDLILFTILDETPLFVINLMIILLVLYGCILGIEVLGRAGEIFFFIIFSVIILFIFLVFAADLPKLENLQPFMEKGIMGVVKTVFPLTITFPFGELILFTMFFPYLNNPKKVKKIGLMGIILSGILLSITIAINISVLGALGAENAPFPLYKTVEKIKLFKFIERLDPIVIITLIIGGFFKIVLFSYGAIIGVSEIFKDISYKKVTVSICFIILFLSLYIASNFPVHIEIGLKIVPIFLHVPLQIGIPFVLVIVTFIKNHI